jgi:hypothetical protein
MMSEKEVFDDQLIIIPGDIAYPMQQIAEAMGLELEEIVNEILSEYIKLTNDYIISQENTDI